MKQRIGVFSGFRNRGPFHPKLCDLSFSVAILLPSPPGSLFSCQSVSSISLSMPRSTSHVYPPTCCNQTSPMENHRTLRVRCLCTRVRFPPLQLELHPGSDQHFRIQQTLSPTHRLPIALRKRKLPQPIPIRRAQLHQAHVLLINDLHDAKSTGAKQAADNC